MALVQLRAAARLVARGYAARRGGEVPRAGQSVERMIPPADPRQLRRYLRATAGTALAPGIEADALPPLYPCTWETLAALELLSVLEPALPLGSVVHAGSEILVPRPPSAGDALRCRLELSRAESAADGMRLEVVARNWTPAGLLCTESVHRFRIRSGAGRRGPDEPSLQEGWDRVEEWSLDAGAGRRYARASGDWNPIHLWTWTARPLGFRQPILHGFCTAARIAHAACERFWDRNPRALRRLRVTFRAPLPLPGTAVLWMRDEGTGHAFRLLDHAGERLFAEGELGGA